MKPYRMIDFTNQNKTKLIQVLNKRTGGGKALLVWHHGFGDTIEFLRLYETLKKDYPNWKFNLGCHSSLQFKILHDDFIYLDKYMNPRFVLPYGKSYVTYPNIFDVFDPDLLEEDFDIICGVQFWDNRYPNNSKIMKNCLSKVEMCKILEFGYPEEYPLVKYTPPFMKDYENIPKKKEGILVHFGGHTDKSIKNPSLETQEIIWNEIIECGLEPFDLHVNSASNLSVLEYAIPPFMKPEQTLRLTNSTLQDVIYKMLEYKNIIGVLSGPLHAGNLMYGGENCLALQGVFKIHNYIENEKLEFVEVLPQYTKGNVTNWINKHIKEV